MATLPGNVSGETDGPGRARVAITRSLKDFGLTPVDLDRAADLAVRAPYYNPRRVTRGGVRALLQAAYEGQFVNHIAEL